MKSLMFLMVFAFASLFVVGCSDLMDRMNPTPAAPMVVPQNVPSSQANPVVPQKIMIPEEN